MSSPENNNYPKSGENSTWIGRNLSNVERLARLSQTLARFDLRPRDLLLGVATIELLVGAQFCNPRPANNNTLPEVVPVNTPVSTPAEQCSAEQQPPLTGIQVYSSKDYFGPTIDNAHSFRQGIKAYLNDYLNCDIGRLFADRREFNVFTFPNPVSMRVIAEDGIVLHDFPDKRPAHSRQIPTKGPGTGPYIKAFYLGHEIPGEFQTFAFERSHETGQLINIWAARLSDEGGWSFSPKPDHPEFFRVLGINPETREIEEYVSMKNADGQQVSVKDFFWPLDSGRYPE